MSEAMNIYLSRAGQQQGPYPVESLAEMIRYGGVQPTDLLRTESESNWVPVSAFLEGRGGSTPALSAGRTAVGAASPSGPMAPPPIPTGPPPLPATPPAADFNEMERAVVEGGRYVVFQFCVSALIITFKRASPVTFLRADQDGFGQAFG